MNIPDLLVYGFIVAVIIGLMALFWIAGGYIMFFFIDRRLRACPGCKCKAAGTIIETGKEPISNAVDRKGRKPVRVKVEKVTDHYQCEHCGHTWSHTFERTERTPIQGVPLEKPARK
jgi:hypothetical protein